MVRFTRAEEEQADVIARLRQQVWATTYRGIYRDEEIDEYDFVGRRASDRFRLMNPNLHTYLIWDGPTPIGYFCFGTAIHPTPADIAACTPPICLNALYLLLDYQRQGIGRQVFGFVAERLREQQIDRFYNACNAHNEGGLAFYRRLGGRLLGVSEGHEDRADDQWYFEHLVCDF